MKTFLAAVLLVIWGGQAVATAQSSAPPPLWIGYTQYRANLPGGRPANVMSRRACVVRADGTGMRQIAPELTAEPNHWSEVVGWSPDGAQVIVQTGWLSDEYADWERAHNKIRLGAGRIIDCCLVDLATGRVHNLTASERVAHYNSSLFFRPHDAKRLGFVAVMDDGQEKVYLMNPDGANKRAATGASCSFSISRDGMHIAYKERGRLFLANADGSHAIQVETGKPFNHLPLWSPDGRWVEFVAGENNNDAHPYIVRSDGTGLRKIGDRNGYEGWASDFDPPDYRQSSGDYPCWSQDSQWVYYTARVGKAVELLRVSLAGVTEQMTHSPPGTLTYDPKASPDGRWIAFGSNRDGVRQLYVACVDGSAVRQLTHLQPGQAAKFVYWQELK